MPDPRLAEARQREREAHAEWVRKGFLPAPEAYGAWVAARRATDEALVAAALQWFVDENNLEGEVGPINPASLRDALEEG